MKPERIKTARGEMLAFPLMEQGSEEWHEVRYGRVTASEFKNIVTAAKGQLSKSAEPYIHKLIAATLPHDQHGAPPFMPTYWMTRGKDLEPEARAAFEKHTGLKTSEVGFCVRADKFEILGCSPDGLAVDPVTLDYTAGLEMKIPKPETHVATVAGGVMPDEYKQQVHGSLYVTGLPEWHFWSWCPGMRPFHCVVHPDEYTAKVGEALEEFVLQYAAVRAELMPKLQQQPV